MDMELSETKDKDDTALADALRVKNERYLA